MVDSQQHLIIYGSQRTKETTSDLGFNWRRNRFHWVSHQGRDPQSWWSSVSGQKKEKITESGSCEGSANSRYRRTNLSFQYPSGSSYKFDNKQIVFSSLRGLVLSHHGGLLSQLYSEDLEEKKAPFRSIESHNIRWEGQKDKDLRSE